MFEILKFMAFGKDCSGYPQVLQWRVSIFAVVTFLHIVYSVTCLDFASIDSLHFDYNFCKYLWPEFGSPRTIRVR